ncbi:MAG: TetR/AcrR family transcriptional regulator [Gemmatimonadetes bacterium]|jgi:AcrR family transcriptional regulator|nr:TetR/AcrR family transcriptional regulator [Gemmatimonadota bacterium]MBT5146186.1 TetR/AcrR family transcriptional regulator [Gemmatimonadota bacterium]MBT5590829.1 TetR/AcrR family transcriptional regulator [Gemmatimonadota bacterium]MBT5961283.1 TetR/AcrR family transcriptional regulator [Gemmatimonadota bacterium]MBT6629213.1 TetR/AcrR family transcriptional regulator [Gemmatimonadota bacterium]
MIETTTPAQTRRRQAIVRAAEHQFAEKRFDEVLMEDVAAEASVGKGTLYRYFEDKESLYFAVVMEGFDALIERLRSGDVPADPVERLQQTVASIVGYLRRDRFFFRLMGRDEGEGRRRGFKSAWKRRRAALVDEVAQVLRDGAQAGTFEIRHLHTDAQILLGMVRSCMRFNEQGLDDDQIVAEIVRIFAHGVRRDES